METDDFLRDLELLLRSRHAIVFLETMEQDRAQVMLEHLADSMKLPFFIWTRTKGLRPKQQLAVARDTVLPLDALRAVEAAHRPALYNFQGLGEELEDRIVTTALRDAARQFRSFEGSIVVTGGVPELPPLLKPLSSIRDLPPPRPQELRALVERLYRDLSRRQAIEIHLTRGELDQLVRNLQGLTLFEAEKVLTKAMIEDGRLGPEDIGVVIEAKRDVLEREGLLHYYPTPNGMEEVAGLKGLKSWLAKRREILAQPQRAAEFGLEFPRGVLLIGVQGSGKSLCAKAVAADWRLPLIKMDPAGLYNKYIGETERNFRRAITTAEKMAPVVLWIDEMEKAFAAAGDIDGGVSQRVLGTFLTWLQERRGDVFVVATANDITRLPPELLRKGRFDEIFFLDLPDFQARQAILRIHLERRRRDPAAFDLPALARAAERFSGAELEQAVVSGLATAFADGGELSNDILLAEIRQTRPLAVTMAESVEALRSWARERAVPADG